MRTQKEIIETHKKFGCITIIIFDKDTNKRAMTHGVLDMVEALKVIMRWTVEGHKIIITDRDGSTDAMRFEIKNKRRITFEEALQFAKGKIEDLFES